MRWFVDVSSVGKGSDKQHYCVDADSWQRALQAARGLRDDPGPMTGFSIELLDDGFSAVDPIKRQKYSIKKAPDDAELTTAATKPEVTGKPAAVARPATPAHAKVVSHDDVTKVAPVPGSKPDVTAKAPPAPSSKPDVAAKAPPAPSSKPDVTAKAPPVPPSKPDMLPGRPPLPSRPDGAARPSTPSKPDLLPVRPNAPSKPDHPRPPTGSGPEEPQVLSDDDVKPSRSSRPPAPELNLLPKGSGRRASEPPRDGAPEPQAKPLVHELMVLAERTQDAGPDGPLTYREFAYLVDGAVARARLETLLQEHLARVRESLAGMRPGKLVNLAIFDVPFTGRPPRPPLATLTWKDWRAGAVVEFPASNPAPKPAPAPEAASAVDGPSTWASLVSNPDADKPSTMPAPPPPADQAPTAPPPKPATFSSVPTQIVAPQVLLGAAVTLKPEADSPPVSVSPASLVQPATRAPSGQKRVRGDELISDLFEAMHDLQFLRDSVEGADFCLALALEKMPASGGIVHLYDINRREFVIISVGGSGGVGAEVLLGQRNAESDPVLSSAMRRRRALVIAEATKSESVRTRTRYGAFGGARSLAAAPVALGGRFVGAIELLNPIDDVPFNDDDGHALSYIAEQLATFVGEHGIVLERSKSQPPAGRSAGAR